MWHRAELVSLLLLQRLWASVGIKEHLKGASVSQANGSQGPAKT